MVICKIVANKAVKSRDETALNPKRPQVQGISKQHNDASQPSQPYGITLEKSYMVLQK